MDRHDRYSLVQLQSLPLEDKIQMSLQRIKVFYEYFDGAVYVSFSGGKDSTVLLHLVRTLYPDVKAVFSDTGLEYPEIRDFVKSVDNVEFVRPKKSFRQVILEFGYPVISKEVSQKLEYSDTWGKKYFEKGSGASEFLNLYRYKYLLDAPFKISAKCCRELKKSPADDYVRRSGEHPFIGTLAEESKLRYNAWIKNGCNVFDSKRPHSAPLSFWTENDILTYIKEKKITYCNKLYGDIVRTGIVMDVMGQKVDQLKTSDLDRTGCMFCLFGIHLEKEPNRIQKLALRHPKIYEYILKPVSEGGLGMKEVMEYVGIPYKPIIPEKVTRKLW